MIRALCDKGAAGVVLSGVWACRAFLVRAYLLQTHDLSHRAWTDGATMSSSRSSNFPDLIALKDWLERRCKSLWQSIPHGHLAGSVADVWAEEQAALMPVPPAFDGFVEQSKRVAPTCLISFERNRYSVPASFANRPVQLFHKRNLLA